MQNSRPVVRANVTLLQETNSPKFVSSGSYRPHIVMGQIDQRAAILDSNNIGVETYIGVAFVGGPEKLNPGETAEIELVLIYYPNTVYDDIKTGATFTIREGSTIVGYGTLLSQPQF